MDTKYIKIATQQFEDEKKKLQGAVYKLLPYKENNYDLLDVYFDALLTRIGGLNELFNCRVDIIELMSLLSAARIENDFRRYRKCILDACSLIGNMQESGDINV